MERNARPRWWLLYAIAVLRRRGRVRAHRRLGAKQPACARPRAGSATGMILTFEPRSGTGSPDLRRPGA